MPPVMRLARGLSSVAVAGALLAWCLPVRLAAQTFTGVSPSQPFVLPFEANPAAKRASGRPPDTIPSVSVQTPAPAQPAPPAPPPAVATALTQQAKPPAATVLRHVPNLLSGFRVIGESGTLEWPIFLTSEQAADRLRLRVGYLTAVSDAPESSTLVATVNDVEIGRTDLEAPTAVKTVEFEVPVGLTQDGFNAVRLSISQRHRVDCSVAATYELWTQIDPAQTGLLMSGTRGGISDPRDLAALSADASGGHPIRIVMAAKPSLVQLRRIFRIVQAVALAGRFAQPIVDFGPVSKDPHTLNLAIGSRADLDRLDLGVRRDPTMAPDVIVRQPTAAAPAAVIIEAETDDGIERAVAQLTAVARDETRGSAAGLRALVAMTGKPVQGGERFKLSELGLVSQEFSGRLFRAAFNVVMPADFLPADYAKATLELAGGYAPGLLPGAQVLIHINGKSVASDRLPKSSGDVFKQKQITLPLGYWQAGVNHIEVLAEVPTAADAACDVERPAGASQRFLFLDNTTLAMPRFARVAHMPELAATAGGGLPFTAAHTAKLYIPVPDRLTVGATATLVARLAVASNTVVDFELASQPPAPGSGATLVVAPARTLDKDLLANVGIEPGALQHAWEQRSKAPLLDDARLAWADAQDAPTSLQRDEPMFCRVPRWLARPSADVSAEPAPEAAPSAPAKEVPHEALFDKWNDDLNARTDWFGWAVGGLGRAFDWTAGKAKSSAQWTVGRFAPGPARAAIEARHSLVVAQNVVGRSLDDVITLVTAPNAELLAASMPCLTDPRVWTRLSGRLSALDGSDGTLSSLAADKVAYVATAPLSFENLRLIAAGWLSNNPVLYVVLILLVALCLGVTTTRVVQNTGRRQP